MTTPADPRAAFWDDRYAGDAYLFGTAPNEFLADHAHLIEAAGRVLCPADGEGRNSVWLAEQGFHVDAFDASAIAIAKAKRLAEDRGVDVALHLATVAGYPWPVARYDAVAAVFVQFLHPHERPGFWQRIRDALRPGGLLLLAGYRVEQLQYGTGGPSVPEQLYTDGQLREELRDFELLEIRSEDREVREGSGHHGRSALIEVVARRPAT